MVTEDGDMSVFGYNEDYQLGLGHRLYVDQPTLLHKDAFGGDDVVMVSAAFCHAACVTSTGTLWMWGMYPKPQSFFSVQTIPTQEFAQSPVLMVACGTYFTMILTRARQVWTCGNGDYGQLGHNNRHSRHQFTQIAPELFGDGAIVSMIAVGYTHSMALTHTAGTGTLWTWGRHDHGELGHGDNDIERLVPSAIPAGTFDGAPVVSMHGGNSITMVVTEDGSLWGCGNDAEGALGLHGTVSPHNHFTEVDAGNPYVYTLQKVVGPEFADGHGVMTAACDSTNSMVLAKNNTLWVCGSGTNICGTGTAPAYTRSLTLVDPVLFGNQKILVLAIGRCRNGVVSEDGMVWLWQVHADRISAPILHARTGRWHDLRHEHTLAFMMRTNARLGAEASGTNDDLSQDVYELIFDFMHFQPHADTPYALHTMMGRRPVRRAVALDIDAPVLLDDEDEE
jgi:alpha-tubulin suppressor-like RCC1 family protein